VTADDEKSVRAKLATSDRQGKNGAAGLIRENHIALDIIDGNAAMKGIRRAAPKWGY